MRIKVSMLEILKEAYDPFSGKSVSQPLIKALDNWLSRNRIYFVPPSKTLWDLYKNYSLKDFISVLSRRPSSKLEESDAARIWKTMGELVYASPRLY